MVSILRAAKDAADRGALLKRAEGEALSPGLPMDDGPLVKSLLQGCDKEAIGLASHKAQGLVGSARPDHFQWAVGLLVMAQRGGNGSPQATQAWIDTGAVIARKDAAEQQQVAAPWTYGKPAGQLTSFCHAVYEYVGPKHGMEILSSVANAGGAISRENHVVLTQMHSRFDQAELTAQQMQGFASRHEAAMGSDFHQS